LAVLHRVKYLTFTLILVRVKGNLNNNNKIYTIIAYTCSSIPCPHKYTISTTYIHDGTILWNKCCVLSG